VLALLDLEGAMTIDSDAFDTDEERFGKQEAETWCTSCDNETSYQCSRPFGHKGDHEVTITWKAL
jgi:hypothetical protein